MRGKKLRLEDLAADVPYAIVGGPFGSKLTSADYVEDGVPVIRGTNLNAGRYLTNDGFVYVSEQKVQDDLFGNLAHSGDIVFTQRGTLGHDPFFVFQMLKSLLRGVGTQKAAVPGVDRNVLHTMLVVWPSAALRQAFVESVRDNQRQIRVLTAMNDKLAEARDLLLPRLMSGEISV